MNVTSRAVNLSRGVLPWSEDLTGLYTSGGGRLTAHSSFGIDRLSNNIQAKDQRVQLFNANQPSVDDIFSNVLHGDFVLLQNAIEYFYFLSTTL